MQSVQKFCKIGALFALVFLSLQCQNKENMASADTIIHHVQIWSDTLQDADWIAIRDGKIEALGKGDYHQFQGPETALLDGQGAFVTPGFIDAHVHFLMGGANLLSVQLRDAGTRAEFIERIAGFAGTQKPGTFITGGDWNHELWGGALPERSWIDSVTPDNPVFLNRLDGHMALANTKALELAGLLDAPLPVIDGGEVVIGPDGKPTGIFKDNAMGLIDQYIQSNPEEVDRALDTACQYVLSNGVTMVHHMGTWDDYAVFRRNRDRGDLSVRIYSVTPLAAWERLRDTIAAHGTGDDHLWIGGLKGFVDGSLGSHTAAFFEPFSDKPDDTGLLVNSEADLEDWISHADQAGLHVIVHAIGDRANAILLDIYHRLDAKNGARDRRFRIEHAQHLNDSLVQKIVSTGTIASMQPYHAIDDGCWAEKVIGPERIKMTYAFRSLLDAGAHVAFGSDWFVAPPDVLAGIYAAATRRTLDGQNPDGWVPEQKITVEQGLRAYTSGGAYACKMEDRVGRLEPGYLADLVVMDRNLLTIAPESIRETRIMRTMVDGKWEWIRTED